MSRIVQATFDGYAGEVNIGLGFIPDRVQLYNLEAAGQEAAIWERKMSVDMTRNQAGGWFQDSGVPAEIAMDAGIKAFRGGNTITAVAETYLYKDPAPDKRYSTTYGQIKTWTLDDASTKAGHFNVAIGSYIAAGSQIVIDGVVYFIYSITDGIGASDTVLSEAVPSGEIDFIGYQFSHIAAPIGHIMSAGISIYNVATLIANSETMLLVAEQDD